MISVIQRQKANVVNSSYKRNLSFDSTALILTKENFDMAAFVIYTGREQNIKDNIDTYFTMRFYQTELIWEFNEWRLQEIGVEKCTEGRFVNLNESTKVINITDNFWCPNKNFSLKLQGSSSSETASQLYLSVDYCDQKQLDIQNPGKKKKCKTIDESNQILAFTLVNFAVLTQYFDGNHFEKSPIVNNIQTFLYPLNEYISYNQMFKYSLNYAITQDSWLANAYDNKNLTYSTIRSDYLQIGTRELKSIWPLLSIQIDLDQDYVVTQRTVMTVLDAFSNVGGLMGIIIPFISMFMSRIQHQLFMQSIIKQIFHYRPKTKSKQKLPENDTNQENSNDSIFKNEEVKNTLKIGPNYARVDYQSGYRTNPQTTVTQINDNFAIKNDQNDSEFELDDSNRNYQRNDSNISLSQCGTNRIRSSQIINTNKISQNLVDIIFKKLRNLKHFQYNLKDLMKYHYELLLKKISCKRLEIQSKIARKQRVYERATETIMKELDLVRIIKSVRKSDLIQKTVFSKYQTFFIPFLKVNILKDQSLLKQQTQSEFMQQDPALCNNDLMRLKATSDDQLRIFIQELIIRSQKDPINSPRSINGSVGNNQIDRRILKNILEDAQSKIEYGITQGEIIKKQRSKFSKHFDIAQSAKRVSRQTFENEVNIQWPI
eukprot:403368102